MRYDRFVVYSMQGATPLDYKSLNVKQGFHTVSSLRKQDVATRKYENKERRVVPKAKKNNNRFVVQKVKRRNGEFGHGVVPIRSAKKHLNGVRHSNSERSCAQRTSAYEVRSPLVQNKSIR